MGLDAREPVFGDLKPKQAQTSVRICAYWSAPSLFADWKVSLSKLASSKISIFQLVSEAEETGLNLALSGTPKTGCLATRLR